jgi:L-arabinose transport system substrate-binding protein
MWVQRICLAGLCLAAVLAGCDKGKPDAIRIGFLVKQPEDPWFQSEWKFAQKCADTHGFELIKIGTPDPEKVISAIDSLAAQGAGGFVICTPDVKLGPAIAAKAGSYGLKVFTVDDQLVGPDGKPLDIPYMGISAREIGRTVGKGLYEEFKRRGWKLEETAACAITRDELPTTKDRSDGAIEALTAAGFPADKIYRVGEKTMDIQGAFDAGNIALTQHADVKRWLVFSVNEAGVLGAVRAMENRGFDAETVIGIGIGAENCKSEFEKPKPTGFYATCMISSKRHGYDTTEHLYKWVKENAPPPKTTLTGGTIVTRETYKQALKEEGQLD